MFRNKILLTRPIHDALEMSKKIGSNFEIFISPLLEIIKIDYEFPDENEIDITIITSKNALRFFEDEILKKSKLTFTVGPGTKTNAIKKGINNIIDVDGDLQKLKNRIKPHLKDNMNILHPTSTYKDKSLPLFFKENNCNYLRIECYEAKLFNKENKVFESFFKDCEGGIVTLFSGRTALSFQNEIKKMKLENYCKNKFVICLSENIQNEIKTLKFKKKITAEKPNEQSFLRIIKNFSKEEKFEFE